MPKWPSLPKLWPVNGYDGSSPSGWMAVRFVRGCYWLVSLCFHKDYMPFSDIYVSTFKHEAEYRQLLIQTALALQTNKFMQVRRKDTSNLSLLQTSLVNLKVFLDTFQQCSLSVKVSWGKASPWHAGRVCTDRLLRISLTFTESRCKLFSLYPFVQKSPKKTLFLLFKCISNGLLINQNCVFARVWCSLSI